MKDVIFKNTDVNKYYKSYILKKNMISFNYRDHQMFYSEKYNSNDIINEKLPKNFGNFPEKNFSKFIKELSMGKFSDIILLK